MLGDLLAKLCEPSDTNLPDGCRYQPNIRLFEKHAQSGIGVETAVPQKSESDREALRFKSITVKRKTVSLEISREQIIKQFDGISLLGRIARIQSAPNAANIFGWINKRQQPNCPLSHALHAFDKRLPQERCPLDNGFLSISKQNVENCESSRIEHHVRENRVLHDLSVQFQIGEVTGHLFKSENSLEANRAVLFQQSTEKRIHR